MLRKKIKKLKVTVLRQIWPAGDFWSFGEKFKKVLSVLK